MDTVRILVVIPDPEARARWMQAATAAGYRSDGAEGAVAAIGAARAPGDAPLAAVVIDGGLPGMGPALLLRALRSIPGQSALAGMVAGVDTAGDGLVPVADPAGLASALCRLHGAAPVAPADPPPRPEEADPVLDRAVVARVRGYGEEMFQGLVGTYLDELPQRLAQIAQLLHAGEVQQAGAIAHALKGSSGSLGLKRLWRACADLDQFCRSGVGDQGHGMAAVQTAAAEATTAMRAELARRPGQG